MRRRCTPEYDPDYRSFDQSFRCELMRARRFREAIPLYEELEREASLRAARGGRQPGEYGENRPRRTSPGYTSSSRPRRWPR
jgi:hypothetical protein